MNDKVKKLAPVIWQEIKKASNILLHLHPSPDADSIGSSLSMMHVLKSMGKKATIIKGDSDLPKHLSHLSGFDQIIDKNYHQTLTQVQDDTSRHFDLFIILDSGALNQISRLGEVKFPNNMKTLIIDHHQSNPGFGDINLVDSTYPATCQILYDLFKIWGVNITKEIASCLILGIYQDSGGFKYQSVSPETFLAASDLAKINPDFFKDIFLMENSQEVESIIFQGLALSNIETYFKDQIALSLVSSQQLKEKNIKDYHISPGKISDILRSVVGWEIVGCLVEKSPNEVIISFRTRDSEKYDLSKLASVLGGGGHRGASGATIYKPLDQAKNDLLSAIKTTYAIIIL